MVSESLHKFYLAIKISPVTPASFLLEHQNFQYLLKWLEIPLMLQNQIDTLSGLDESGVKKGYKPSEYGLKQQQMRAKFRMQFLQVIIVT